MRAGEGERETGKCGSHHMSQGERKRKGARRSGREGRRGRCFSYIRAPPQVGIVQGNAMEKAR